MSIPYELIVYEDLNRGHGTVSVTMPAGGSATGNKVGIHSFLGDFFNVKDFGAIGDGSADDTAAIQAALDMPAPITASGRVVFLPAGIYRITAPLLPLAETLIMGAGKTASYIRYTPATNGTKIVFANDVSRVHLRDLAVQSNGNDQICVEFYRNVEHTLFNVALTSLSGGSGTGLRVRALINGLQGNCYGCSFENQEFGVQIGLNTDGGTVLGTADSESFFGCRFTSNTTGMYIDNGNQVSLYGCRFEDNTAYGLRNSGVGQCTTLTVVACWFENNPTRHFLLDNVQANSCAFINCVFAAGTADIGTNITNYFLGSTCDTSGPTSGYGVRGINGYHRVSDGECYGNMRYRVKQPNGGNTPTLGVAGPMAGGLAPYEWVNCIASDGTSCVQPIWKLPA